MDNMGVPRITVGDSQAPENTTQIATTGTLYAVPSQKTTTLNMAGNLNATATEITLDSTAGFVAGDIIQIATSGVNYGSDPEVHEQIKIDSVDSSSVLTVTRSFNGTAGVSYVDNANIKGYQGHNEAKTFPNIPLQFHHNISAVLSETRSSTQLAEALDNSETQIDVDSTSGFLVGQYLLVDSEVMKITAISGTTRFTVLRGQEGTSAATHNDNTAVTTWVNSNFGQTATEIYRQGYTMSSTTYQDSAYNTGDNPGRGRNLIIHDDGGEQRNPEIPKDLTTNYETLQVASRLVANNLAIQAPRFYGSTWGTGTAQSQLHPTYSFSTDLDTGMYQEAANQLDWSVGGVREMTLVGDGLTIHGNLTIDGTFSNTEASQFGGKVAFNFDDSTLTADGTTAALVAHYGGTYYAGFPRGRLAHIQPGDRLFIDVAQHADNHQEDIRITNASADGTQVDIRRPNAGVTSIGGTTMKFLTTGTDYTATDTVLVISTDAWLDPGTTRRQAELTVAGTGEKLRVINKTTVGSEDAITVERGYMGTTAAAITHNTAFTVARSGSFSAASGTYNSHTEAFLGRQFECGNILALPFNELLDNDASADYNPGTLAGTTVGADRYLCDIRPAYSFQQDQGAGMWLMTTTTGNMLGFTVSGTELLSVGFNGNIASEHAAKLYIGRNWEGATNTGNTYHEVTTIVHGNIIPDRNGTMSSGPAQSYTHSHTIGTNAYPWHGFWSESNVNVTSDIRIKENITDITNGLDIIMALSPIKYNKLEETEIEFGFSAQDVKAQLLNLGYSEDISIYSDDEDIWSLQYEQLIAPLVAAIQELKAELDELKNG